MINKRFAISAALIGLIFAGLGASLGAKKFEPAPAADNATQKLFALSLNDAQSKPQAIKQWQGKFLVVNFWATWCKPCVEEMPELSLIHAEMSPKGIKVIGLAVDSPSNVREFAEKHKFSYPLLVAGASGTELAKRLGNRIDGLPYTALIDDKGIVLRKKAGRIREEELRSWISEVR